MNSSAQLRPILTAHLFPVIEERLVELLESLTPDEWERQTVAPDWKVKDVAAHLLDTQLRKLSISRDGYLPQSTPIEDLVAFINRLNHEGVTVCRRLSPPVLIALMKLASRESAEYHSALDPYSRASFGVSWAGEETSLNWFDTAREYTERWHHQQQIRLAVGREGIMTPELYHPVIDCFLRALPYTYRDVQAETGTALRFRVTGACGGDWWLRRDLDAWCLTDSVDEPPVSCVTIPQEIAWRIFTKGMDPLTARSQVEVKGNTQLGFQILMLRAIVG